MQNNKAAQSFLFFGKLGCFLPTLIFFNLAFGLIFFDFRTWFLVEAGLVALFFLVLMVTMKKASSFIAEESARPVRKDKRVIDVEAKVVNDPKDDIDGPKKLH